MKILKLTLLLFLLFNGIQSQHYLWPTNSGYYLTSTFCEFRPDHYHSGIDIKTWNKEGYPCYAIEDGHIECIKISPFGYGKVLYLRLKDGRLAVYAHLQRFTKEIDRTVRKIQMRSQRYRVKWRPKKLKVKRGEIIAYTGSTGIGTPHLHFEIRKSNDITINPLVYYSKYIKDNIPPVLQKIAVIPLSKNSTVNDSYLPQTLSLTHLTDNIYIIGEPLFISGRVGLAIKLYDQAEGLFNRFSFYQITMKVQTEDVFTIRYDELDFDKSRYINTAIYYPFWSDNKEVYYKLYLEDHNSTGFYHHYSDSDGSFYITNKPVPFSVVVSDYKGNRSIVKGELIPAIKKEIEIQKVVYNNSKVDLTFVSDPLDRIDFFESKDGFNWNKIDRVAIKNINDNPKPTVSAEIFFSDSSYNYLQLSARSDFNKLIRKKINLHTDSINSIDPGIVQPKLNILDERLVFSLNNFYDGNYQAQISEDFICNDTLELKLFYHNQNIWKDSYHLKKFLPAENSNFSWYDSSFILNSYKQSFFDTSYLTIKLVQPDLIKQKVPVASKIYHILPDNIALFKSIEITMTADSLVTGICPNGKGMNWSIYQTDGLNNLTYIPSNFDTTSMIFQASTRSLGKFVIAADTVLPEIIVESPVSGEVYYNDPKIKFFIQDSISGIENEEDISIQIDGKFVLPEWDPENNIVEARFDQSLETGRRTLEIAVRDRAGNINTKNIYFTIHK
jgi:hypothetical protein